MRKLTSIAIIIIGVFLYCKLLGTVIPNLGILFEFILQELVKDLLPFYIGDELVSYVLYFLICLIGFGGIYVSKKQENDIWLIVSFIMAIISLYKLFVLHKI